MSFGVAGQVWEATRTGWWSEWRAWVPYVGVKLETQKKLTSFYLLDFYLVQSCIEKGQNCIRTCYRHTQLRILRHAPCGLRSLTHTWASSLPPHDSLAISSITFPDLTAAHLCFTIVPRMLIAAGRGRVRCAVSEYELHSIAHLQQHPSLCRIDLHIQHRRFPVHS